MRKKFKYFWIQYLKDALYIILGTTIMSVGIVGFYSQADVTPSGLYGLTTIFFDLVLNHPSEIILRLCVGLTYLGINLIILMIIRSKLGIKFIVNTCIAITNYIVLNVVLQKTPIYTFVRSNLVENASSMASEYGILCSIFGGIFMGIGLGIVLRHNGSTGGCDLLAAAINKVNPSITPGQVMLTVDCLVVISCFSFYNIKASLYAPIGIYLCDHVADMIIDGVNSLRAYFIITDNPETVSDIILKHLKRGVTKINCEGMYSKQDKSMLLCLVRNNQVYVLKQVIKAYDEHAFMFSVSAKEAYGLGFVNFEKSTHVDNLKKLEKMLDENV